MTRGDDRLQEKAIDCFVGILEGREVDLAIPAGEELVVSNEPGGKRFIEKDARLRRPTRKSCPEVASHEGSL